MKTPVISDQGLLCLIRRGLVALPRMPGAAPEAWKGVQKHPVTSGFSWENRGKYETYVIYCYFDGNIWDNTWENIGKLFEHLQFIAIFMGEYREILNLLVFFFFF